MTRKKTDPLLMKSRAFLVDHINLQNGLIKSKDEVIESQGIELLKLDKELRIAKAANNTTNKALQDDQAEIRRLRKVLDRAITATEARIHTVMPKVHAYNGPRNQMEERQMLNMPLPQPVPMTEEQKYLQFMFNEILHDQFKPEQRDRDNNCGWPMDKYQ